METIQKTLDIDARVQKMFELVARPVYLSIRRSSGAVILSEAKDLSVHRARHKEISRFRSLVTCALIALLLSGLAVLFGPGSHASALTSGDNDGFVYVLNNDLSGSNSITIFSREEDGSLTLQGVTPIGGLGSLAAFGTVNAGTQGSLIITHDEGTRLFAVDAGSDQISVINVHNGHLTPVGVFSSGGSGPVSLSYRDGLLYVLNAANASTQAANVTGFHVDDAGNLHPIAGSTRPLSSANPNPAEVLIDPFGPYVLVSEKNTNLIDVYRIHDDGSLSGPTTFPSVGAVPFGMAFDPASPRHELIVADAAGGPNFTGASTAYRFAGGTINLINGPVPDFQIAPCWMVVTSDGNFAYTSDADSHTISGYRIHADGTISLLNSNASTPADTFPLEEALSNGSTFLYVLDSRLLLSPPGPATLGGYRIHSNGSLTSVVNSTKIVLPFSAIGLAAE